MISKTEAIAVGLRIKGFSLPRKERPFEWLPVKQRAIVILKLANFTDEEIADIIQISRKTVHNYLQNLREYLP